ncbi:MAG: chemotaxis protein CheW [Planctomycetota bacterium]|nr:chemotaxis protein CheW [Planctomycetota bacterium]
MNPIDDEKDLAILRQRAHYYSKKADVEKGSSVEVITFARADTVYGVLIKEFREVRVLPSFCRIPGASPIVPGVFPYRGEILSVHDLAMFMEKERRLKKPEWALVVESNKRRLAILADEVFGVEEVFDEDIQGVPLTLNQRGQIFSGLVKKTYLLIDVNAAFQCTRFTKSI